MESLSYLEIFRQRWLAIVIAVVLGVSSAAIIAYTIQPSYTSKATLFLSVKDPSATLAERSQFSLARVASYPDLVHSEDVLQSTIDELGLGLSVQQLSGRVSAANQDNTVLIDVTARASNGRSAAAIANAVAENLSDLVSDVENDNAFSVSLERLIPASAPSSPSSPQKNVILGLGLIAGLAAGAIIALLLARFDRRLHTVAGVRRASGLPVLGQIPRRLLPRRHDGVEPIVAAAMADTMLTIRQANGGGVPRLFLLVPAGRRASPARIRIGLADATASTGREVLLVETEPTTENSSELAKFAGESGLTELLSGATTVTEHTRMLAGTRARLLPAGAAKPTGVQAEASIRGVVTRLVSEADVVIAQSTPSSLPANLPLIAPYSDVVVIVARHGHSTDNDLARAVSQLRIIGVRPIGVVLIDVPRSSRTDLSATWHMDDFATKPSKPLISVRRTATRTEKSRVETDAATIHAKPQATRESSPIQNELDIEEPEIRPGKALVAIPRTTEHQVESG